MRDVFEIITEQLHDLQIQIAQIARDLRTERAIVLALMAQHGDPTHITVRRAAELLGLSPKSVRRRIAQGVYTLEVIPGQKEGGIPIEQIYGGWMPIGTLRTAIARERKEAEQEEETEQERE